ncbi:hypothetical protein EVAR_70163_1 [Eumeta japonica]|uniref:Uncharacterized protein n=1 Tax=Eumeta variegata TaxID=151549 RepID=A0A4C1SYP4_EUMVA|nr:hypothetical protein EVAR_70163_1 [Eumeta japonica]
MAEDAGEHKRVSFKLKSGTKDEIVLAKRFVESADELSSISEMSAAYRHAKRLGKNNYKGLLTENIK